jgi:tetratricopeptide (TPR) repeat protein
MAIGLDNFRMDQFAEAQQAFEQALDVEGWNEAEGKEVLYLFLGNAALNLKDFAKAHEWFEKALSVNKEYARAYIGQGFTFYQQAIVDMEQDCPPDPGLLELAVTAFNNGLVAEDKPEHADVDAKAHFGLGRAYMLQGIFSDEGRLEMAQSELELVTAAHERGEVYWRELAAQAYGNLGIVNYYISDDTAAIAAFTKSLELEELEFLRGRVERLVGDNSRTTG